MMKKIMAFLTIFMLVIPFASVKAEGLWYTYGPGDEVNFYQYEGDEVGITTTILSDEGSESQYVKALVTGFHTATSQPYAEAIDGDYTIFKNTLAYRNLLNAINTAAKGFPYAKPIAEDGNLALITLDELKTIFGATQVGETYTIDATKWGKTFEIIQGSKPGMYTQTVEGDDVWVVKFTYDNDVDKNITAITVEKVPVDSATTYELVPVVYFDKTYDCVEREVKENYACYSCDEEYTWTSIGSQADNCKLVETINAKADCVKNPKTGVKEYLVEFLAIGGVCIVAIAVVKRKDLFRSI